MQWVVLILLFLVNINNSVANTKIVEIDYASESENEHLVMFENGNVLFIDSANTDELDKFIDIYESKREVSLYNVNQKYFNPQSSEENYTEKVLNIFDSMNSNFIDDGQCHYRAHVWAYEASLKKVEMNKVFLFFTKRYIREFKFPWWFHVAPSYKDSGEEYILDKAYSMGPLRLKNWTDLFIANEHSCSKIKNYITYKEDRLKKYCYLIETSKFIFQPSQIANRVRKTKFTKRELDIAYKKAFKR